VSRKGIRQVLERYLVIEVCDVRASQIARLVSSPASRQRQYTQYPLD
jgi:hypothetical protein